MPTPSDQRWPRPSRSRVDRRGDTSLPRLGRLGVVDAQHEPTLLTVGEAVEEALGIGLGGQCGSEVVGHSHLARRRVELQLDVDLVARRDAGRLAVLGAQRRA